MPFILGSMSKNYLQAFVRPLYHTYLDDIPLYSKLGQEKQDEVNFITGSMSFDYLQAFVRPAYNTYLDDIPLYVRAGKTGWSTFYNKVDVKK